jgi:hypothetical protein
MSAPVDFTPTVPANTRNAGGGFTVGDEYHAPIGFDARASAIQLPHSRQISAAAVRLRDYE